MNTVLVTGGAGFVGSHLCRALLEDGDEVVCLDNLGSGTRENIAELMDEDRFTLVEGDVRDHVRATLTAASVPADDVDRVFHLASRASPADFDRYPIDIALTNSQGTRRVLEFVEDVDARMVNASTSEVYGQPEVHPQHEEYNGNVDLRGERAVYDEGKRFGETLSYAFNEKYGTDVRIVRIFNTYGPRMRPDDGRVIPNFLTQALAGQDLTVYGDGTQTRCFLYVSDLVTGLRSAMTAPEATAEPINVGSTNEITINTLADVVASTVEADVDITHEPLPENDPQRRKPDISRAAKLLDWRPSVPLEAGLKLTAPYFRDQLQLRRR